MELTISKLAHLQISTLYSFLRHHSLCGNSLDLSQLSGQGADFIGGAFNNERDNADPLIPDGYALPANNDGSMPAEDLIQQLNMVFFFYKDDDGTDSLFHRTFLWVRLVFLGLC